MKMSMFLSASHFIIVSQEKPAGSINPKPLWLWIITHTIHVSYIYLHLVDAMGYGIWEFL